MEEDPNQIIVRLEKKIEIEKALADEKIEKQDKLIHDLKQDLSKQDVGFSMTKRELAEAHEREIQLGNTIGELRAQKQKGIDQLNLIKTELKPTLKKALKLLG